MAIHIRQIAFVAHELAPTMQAITDVLGVEICFRDKGVAVFGLENALVPVGTQFIEVVAPTQEGTAGGRYLERRKGDGGYMVICQCDRDGEQAEVRQRAADAGIRIAWEREHESGNFMQLHPRDTGGSFFEIDWDENKQPAGHWEPAGGSGWETYMKTDRVNGISAAELQSPDPEALAKRWAGVVGGELRMNGKYYELPMANGVIRFGELMDDRGEGLSAIDITTTDKEAVKSAAAKCGVPVEGDTVMLCGVRINLV